MTGDPRTNMKMVAVWAGRRRSSQEGNSESDPTTSTLCLWTYLKQCMLCAWTHFSKMQVTFSSDIPLYTSYPGGEDLLWDIGARSQEHVWNKKVFMYTNSIVSDTSSNIFNLSGLMLNFQLGLTLSFQPKTAIIVVLVRAQSWMTVTKQCAGFRNRKFGSHGTPRASSILEPRGPKKLLEHMHTQDVIAIPTQGVYI